MKVFEKMKVLSGIAVGIFLLVGFLAFGFAIQGGNFFLYKFWAPQYEQVRRETYEQTKSYQKGNADRLSALCGQVANATDKSLLNDQISHEFADVNTSDVPDYLQSCLASARK